MKRIHNTGLVILAAICAFAAGHANADVKISDLPAASALTGTEAVPIVQSATTVKTTTAALSTYIESVLTGADIVSKFSGTCNSGTFLRGDASCAAGSTFGADSKSTWTNSTAELIIGTVAVPSTIHGADGSSSAGANLTIRAGLGSNAAGGSFTLKSGDGGGGGGAGGLLAITGGAGTINGDGGNVEITGGRPQNNGGVGAALGGSVILTGSNSDAGAPGAITLVSGTSTALARGAITANGTSIFSTSLFTSGNLSVARGGTGVGTLTGPVKGNGTSAFSAAASTDIIGLWAGSCTSTTFLKANGNCSSVSLTSEVSGVLPTDQGGTGSSFFKVTGPSVSEKTFTFPNASSTVLTTNAAVTVAQGGTGAATLTGPLKGNGTSAITAAVSSDISGLWSGTCNSGTYLRGDGTCSAPASGSPGGATTNVQYNSSGSFQGEADFSYDETLNTLNVGSTATAGIIRGGNNASSGNGGGLTVRGGTAATSGTGGSLDLVGGTSVGTGGGAVNVTGGTPGTASQGGNAIVTGGPGGATSGGGGTATLRGGVPTEGAGGSVAITARDGVGTNQNGGNVTVTMGAPTGSGTIGALTFVGGTTTGAQTATFTATNKPGSATGAPTLWLRVVVAGTTYWMPLFAN